MRSHAKAAFGGSTPAIWAAGAVALLVATTLSLLLVAPASAENLRLFKGDFGTATQPTFGNPTAIAVDRSSGDLLVVDAGAKTVSRYKPNGEPHPFSALGTNVIDGRKGPEGKPCAEEPVSCDATATEGFLFGAPGQTQISVDESGGVTKGNLYVALNPQQRVDVFAADGHYLGPIDKYQPRSTETQKVSFNGTWVNNSSTYRLGSLPIGVLCGAAETTELKYLTNAGTRAFSIRDALRAACPGGEFESPGTNTPPPPNNTIPFDGKLAGFDIPQMGCTVIVSGGGNCSVQTVTQGGVPGPPAALQSACGVTAAPDGKLYLAESSSSDLRRYVPSAALPQATDNTATFNLRWHLTIQPCNLAMGTAATNGFLFTTGSGSSFAPLSGPYIAKLDAATGAFKYAIATAPNTAVAVNPADGRVLAAAGSVATEYDASGATSAVQTSSLAAPSAIQGIVVNGVTGETYVSRAGNAEIEVYGAPVPTPTVAINAASDVTATKATLNGTVDAEGLPMVGCVFEYGPTASYGTSIPCAEAVPGDSSPHPVSATINGLAPSSTYHYRLVATNSAGPTKGADRTFSTAGQAATEAASGVSDTAATLHGSLNPAGKALTQCKFEYLTEAQYLGNNKAFSGPNAPATQDCVPGAGLIEADFISHSVSASLSGLAKNTTYRFRLTIVNASGTVTGQSMTFTTLGPPRIVGQFAGARLSGAQLQALVNPSGFATTYHFEWGTDASYGTRIPANVELFLGSGTSAVNVIADVPGLAEQSTYHFRVVATNASGTTVGPDSRFTTLNAHGLPDDRAPELVSPADKGPAGSVSEFGFVAQVVGQASTDGNSIVYPIQNGIPDSAGGGWTRWRADRTDSGWLSTELSSPSLVPAPKIDGVGLIIPSEVVYSSADNRCGFVRTYNPLTEDTPQLSVELGLVNLYRWSDEGYELISNRMPLNPALDPSSPYNQIEAADDCSRVYFRSPYTLIAGGSGLYEWEEGTLRDAGVLPNGAPGVDAVIGGETNEGHTSRWNAVSPDGSRLFFSAISNQGPDSGKRAVFMREDGVVTDISQSQTAVPASGARFEAASPDGGRVFFRANYGIAPGAASAGPANGNCGVTSEVANTPQVEKAPCDLYVYDVESGELTDLSPDANPADSSVGAQVQGTVAIDEDGSHVYFATIGQLIPGKGNTYAENVAGFTSANVYLAHEGELSYVTTLGEYFNGGAITANGELFGGFQGTSAALMRKADVWTADTTADGDKLMFAAIRNITGYDSGGAQEVYLYSAESGEVTCLSCRPDGLPSLGGLGDLMLPLPQIKLARRGRAMSEDGSRVFFMSVDALVPGVAPGRVVTGGRSGRYNVYEWHDGQVYFLATVERSGGNGLGTLLDSSASGDDVFIATNEQLATQDKDFVADVYDLRSGGGFPPVVEPVLCNPAADECQGPPAPQPSAPAPASAGFQGAGNPPPANVKQQSKKKKKKASKKKKRNKRSRAAKVNRGGAK